MIAGPGVRRLSSWIDSFLEYTEILPSPPLMRKWAAISFVAAALERKVWVRSMGSDLYPNLYTLLVGPPGVGKGVAMNAGDRIIREVPELFIGPTDLTAASLIDALNEAVCRRVQLGPVPYVEYNSLTIISRELGVLLPAWDASLMNNLTDIYDGFAVDQKRRGKDLRIKIAAPQINLLAGCTPSYLHDTLPAGAWDQGFISRSILVYSGDKVRPDPFREDDHAATSYQQYHDLLHDLKTISNSYGKMSFTNECVGAIRAWVNAGLTPEPDHMKLQSYNARRLGHLLKLSMISSMSKRGDLVIQLDDYSEAFNWLLEVEASMPEIFKAMANGGDSSAMEEAWNYCWSIYQKEKKPVAEHRLIHFLRERVPAHGVVKVLEIMVKAHMLEAALSGSQMGYKPTSRTERLNGYDRGATAPQ